MIDALEPSLDLLLHTSVGELHLQEYGSLMKRSMLGAAGNALLKFEHDSSHGLYTEAKGKVWHHHTNRHKPLNYIDTELFDTRKGYPAALEHMLILANAYYTNRNSIASYRLFPDIDLTLYENYIRAMQKCDEAGGVEIAANMNCFYGELTRKKKASRFVPRTVVAAGLNGDNGVLIFFPKEPKPTTSENLAK